MAMIDVDDKRGFLYNASSIALGYNASDELIWVTYTFDDGREFRQAVTDDSYVGSVGYGDITRTKTFGSWVKQ